ncbi:hypothetical protein HN682_09455 [Candidatus Peregrinibacteria bacterium]|jgi:hypothetical protein|nr:hypothetical protein [Candidatus Peregrinibacteria bacterium]
MQLKTLHPGDVFVLIDNHNHALDRKGVVLDVSYGSVRIRWYEHSGYDEEGVFESIKPYYSRISRNTEVELINETQ